MTEAGHGEAVVERQEDRMSTPLSVLYARMNPNSVSRARNAIESQGKIKDIEELCAWSALGGWDSKCLGNLRNTGPKTIQAIQEGLSALGLSLGTVGPITKPDFSTLPMAALTTRDYIATATIQGVIGRIILDWARDPNLTEERKIETLRLMSRNAYALADDMLKARRVETTPRESGVACP